MSQGQDRLSNELTVSARLEEKAISLNAKSRALSAFDRLLGSLIDVPTSKLEGVAERIRAKNVKRLNSINVNTSPDVIDAVILDGVTEQQLRQITNTKIITDKTIDELRSTESHPEVDVENVKISEEWISTFDRFSKDTTSERLRDIWSRVLTGEILKPGKFSLSTLRFISELDSEIATLFQRYRENILQDSYIIKPQKLEGNLYDELRFLEEAGLLQEVGGFGQSNISRQTDGYCYFFEGDFVLKMLPNSGSENINIPVIFVTRVGRQVASILPRGDAKALLTSLANSLEESAESIELLAMSERLADGRVRMQALSKLK
jgi:hypothetical protein